MRQIKRLTWLLALAGAVEAITPACGGDPAKPPVAPWDDEDEARDGRDDREDAADDDHDDDDDDDEAPADEQGSDTAGGPGSTDGDGDDDGDDDADDAATADMEPTDGDGTATDDRGVRYLIPFQAVVNDLPLLCGQKYAGVGSTESTIEVRDFRFYLHDIELLDAEGRGTPLRIQSDGAFHLAYEKADGTEGGLVLLDFTDTSSNVCNERGTPHVNGTVAGFAPEDRYRGLRFKLGVPAELNHIEGAKAPSPLNAYGMQWSWASGYRYLKADIRAVTGAVVKDKYYMHSGATGCSADDGTVSGSYECDNRLISEIEFPIEIGVEAVHADLAALYTELDLSLGTGCMGSSSLRDFADGPAGADYAGCKPMYAAIGLGLSDALTDVTEKMGTCGDGASAACRVDDDCGGGAACMDYVPAVSAVPAEQVDQAIFKGVPYNGEPLDPTTLPQVADLSDESIEGWPHPEYERDPELNAPAISEAGGRESHPKGDARFGSNCMACHQAQGPGPSEYLVAGTVHTAGEEIFEGGGVIAIGTGTPNRFGPKTHPIQDRVADFTSLLEIPIDAFGQFYVTADMAPELNYSDENYLALVIGNEGTCKTVETGELVTDGDGSTVHCRTEVDCRGFVYELLGTCDNGDPCRLDTDCADSGSCQGYSNDNPAVCDKLLNAMPLETVGACNHCHGEAFRIQTTPWEE